MEWKYWTEITAGIIICLLMLIWLRKPSSRSIFGKDRGNIVVSSVQPLFKHRKKIGYVKRTKYKSQIDLYCCSQLFVRMRNRLNCLFTIIKPAETLVRQKTPV